MNSKLEERIIALLAQERGIPPGRIKPTSRLLEDLGMDGDDARDFFEMYRTEFEVDVTNMKWDRHFGPEGFNLLTILIPFFKRLRKAHCPVTVEDLINSAKAGEWKFCYESPA